MTPSAPRLVQRAAGEILRGQRAGGEVVGRDLGQVGGVRAGDHEAVAARAGVDVHERHRPLVRADDRGGQLARDDLAEDAIHAASLLSDGPDPSGSRPSPRSVSSPASGSRAPCYSPAVAAARSGIRAALSPLSRALPNHSDGSPLPQKTYNPKPGEIDRSWYVVDADGETLGRLATRIADTLRGKRKPQYAPHVDTGDFVIVVNCERIRVTGNKLEQKIYYRHSGLPGRHQAANARRAARPPSRGGHPARRSRHAAEEPHRPRAAPQAQGVRRNRASARRAAADGAPVIAGRI